MGVERDRERARGRSHIDAERIDDDVLIVARLKEW